MSVKFTHYLITRFNVPVKNWDRDKAGKPVLDDAWMHNRLDLFRRYCVPGVANQTNHRGNVNDPAMTLAHLRLSNGLGPKKRAL